MNRSTRQSSYSRRSSILKVAKQSLTGNASGSSTESSPNIKLKRRVSFAEKKHVKEFCNSLEQGTVWNNTYEERDSSDSKASNSSNDAQADLRSCNQENEIVFESKLHRNSIESRGYIQERNREDDGMDLTESIGVSLANNNQTNINYCDSKILRERVDAAQLILPDYSSNLQNASTYQEMPIEFTEVVQPLSIQPRSYTSVCQYINALPSQESINALSVADVNRTSRINTNKINENSIEFTTPILSAMAAAKLGSELDKENVIPQFSTVEDIPMEFTAAITILDDRVKINRDSNEEEAPLLAKKLLQQVLKVPNFKEAEDTLVFNDSSMEITKAVSVTSFPTTCKTNDNDTKMESSKTQMWCNDDMQMTTVINSHCFIGNNEPLKARLNLKEEEEPIAVSEDKTTIFQDNSMMITTAIPSCFRLANDAAVVDAIKVESNLVGETSQDRECSMEFENQSIEITKAVETPGILSSHCFPNMENCLTNVYNRISTACESANNDCEQEPNAALEEKTTIFQDNSMMITTAIPPCFRLANDVAIVGAINVESNLVEETPEHRECNMQFENQSIEMTNVVETPGILSSHCMPNMQNCLTNGYNGISTACELVDKSCGEDEDRSKESTRAVNTQRNTFNTWSIADKENYPMENENSVNIIRKISRKSLANAPLRSSIVPDLLMNNERNIFPDRIEYPESYIMLNHEDYVSEKETALESSDKITLDSSEKTDNTRHSDMSMELTNVTHIPTSLGSRDYIVCNALRNFSETIPVPTLECNDNRILAQEENDCISTCTSDTRNTSTTDLNTSNHEPAQGILNLTSNENPENETCPQVVTLTANRTNQSCVVFDKLEIENLEEQENLLETEELFSHNSEEDLNLIKPPSFVFIDNMDCDGENVKNVSVNCSWNEEKVIKSPCSAITTFAELPVNSSITNNNDSKAELSNTHRDYIDDGCNYQENNAVRASYSNESLSSDLRKSQTFLIMRKSMGMTSLLIDDDETKQAIDYQAFVGACADNSIANSINCSSILLDKTNNLTEEITNTSKVVELSKTSATADNDRKNDSRICSTASVHVDQSSNPIVKNKIKEILKEMMDQSREECLSSNENNLTKNVEIVEAPSDDLSADEKDVLTEEDPFSSLIARLKEMVKNGNVIWDVCHVDVEKRKLVIGFISSSLLVPILLDDASADFVYFQIARLGVVSRLKADSSDLVIRIAHRLLLEQINTEAHLRSYNEHHNIFQLLEDISTDVKLVLDFIFDLKRLNQLNLMTISDEQIAFTALTRRMEIVLRVKINIKVFSNLEPADIYTECLLGKIREEDVRNLIKNVKRDHKFLRRYINDVKDYIYLMENQASPNS